MKKLMEIITTIDKEFNQRISISDKFKAGKYNDVLDYCNQEIQKSIFETKIYLYRARCHYNLKNYNRAIKDYTEIIVLGDDKKPLIYIERGNAYLQISKYKEALLDYENVLKLSPEQEGIIDRINLLKRM
jgi:tetratricopeptide (TPR) repeat protein